MDSPLQSHPKKSKGIHNRTATTHGNTPEQCNTTCMLQDTIPQHAYVCTYIGEVYDRETHEHLVSEGGWGLRSMGRWTDQYGLIAVNTSCFSCDLL